MSCTGPRAEPAVCLVGLRGAGKSSAGALLARALALPFADLDQALERRAGSVAALLTRDEPAFRALEAECLAETLRQLKGSGQGGVLATGGGVVLSPASRQLLAASWTVYLDAPPEVLAARVGDDPSLRPALRLGGPLAEARALRVERDPHYRSVARTVVDASRPLEDVVAQVLAALASGREEDRPFGAILPPVQARAWEPG